MCLAIPGRITQVRDAVAGMRHGRVLFGGAARDVNLTFVPDADVGDYVIVHVGIALSIVSPEEAARVFAIAEEIRALLRDAPAMADPAGATVAAAHEEGAIRRPGEGPSR